MHNWIMLYEERNYKHLLKSGNLCKRAEKVYELLQDQIVDNFGANEDLLKLLRIETQIELLYAEQVETGDRSNQIFIDIKTIEIDELSKGQNKTDFYTQVFDMQKHLSYRVDVKEISIFDYYKNMKIISNRLKHERQDKK
jgi:hypothetical protein